MGTRRSGSRWWSRGLLALVALVVPIAAIVVFPLGPDAREPDRDQDGLSNRFELKRSHTNPRTDDTDGDGLGDRVELRESNTNPRKRDTDGDRRADGVEFRRQQRAQPRLRDIPVICLSARHDARETAADLDFAGFLSKPFDLESVVAAVRQLCLA